jgi:uncharacterized membrane protein YfcA
MDSIINPTLGIALTLTSLALLLKQQLRRLFQQHRHGWIGARVVRYRDSVTVLVGFVLGILVTLSSIGAGALGTVFLVALYPSLPIVAIVATELAHAVVLAAVAGAGHWHLGTVNLALLTFLLMGSIPGAYIGSHVGVRLPECYVRPILASMLLFVGLRFTL